MLREAKKFKKGTTLESYQRPESTTNYLLKLENSMSLGIFCPVEATSVWLIWWVMMASIKLAAVNVLPSDRPPPVGPPPDCLIPGGGPP